MDGEVGKVRTERIYTLPTGGRGGRRQDATDTRAFRVEQGEEDEPNTSDQAPNNEHGSVGHPDDDEAGRNLDITG